MTGISVFRLLLVLCSLSLGYGLEVEQVSDQFYTDELHGIPSFQPYRTAYHFQPAKNWINDPNGPMVYKGLYHFLYQYNPFGAVWSRCIVWAHATSKDLVNWVHHEHAMIPSQPYDIKGCWSGSVTILPGNKPVILYTGKDQQSRQVQNLAVRKDLNDIYLREWIKSPLNPLLLPTPQNRINASSFRDPTTAWKGSDGRWRMLAGSKRDQRGIAILYRSKDFIHWIKSQHPIHSASHTGMWECPDFFPVYLNSSTYGVETSVVSSSVKHVLKNSLDNTKHDYYTVGKYLPQMDKYIPDPGSVEGDSGLRYDYGKFYASKTFFDSVKNRRILWGWVNESSSMMDDIKKGWSGIQAVPRSLWLDKTGKQLVQWPVPEIEKLRKNRVTLPSKQLNSGSVIEVSGVTASQADVEVSFELSKLEKAEPMNPSWVNPQLLCSEKGASVKGSVGPFGILVFASKHLEEQTAIFFRVFKGHNNKYIVLMCSDQSRSSLREGLDKTTYGAFLDVNPVHEKLSLRTLIDHSVVESFGGGGKVCISARVYPKIAIDNAAHLYAFNNGTQSIGITKLNAWTMGEAQIN